MSNTHMLKLLPQYFKPVEEGTKTFEIRENDRDYKVGDTLILREYLNNDCLSGYTGQAISKEVSYILEGGQYGLEDGYCILGLKEPLNSIGNCARCGRTIINHEICDCVRVLLAIELRNIDLKGLTLVDELVKAEEEEKEFKEALVGYLYDKHEISREHILEELCDTIQVKLSVMKTIDIDIETITDYWNTKHLEKIKLRPKKEN